MVSPVWSPDGRFIAGLTGPNAKVAIYEFATQKQTAVSYAMGAFPGWSRDGESLFFHVDQAWWRLRMSDRKVEQVVMVNKIPVAVDGWFAPGPNHSLVTSRSIGNNEIYALDWRSPD
jgi:hypothetical protein